MNLHKTREKHFPTRWTDIISITLEGEEKRVVTKKFTDSKSSFISQLIVADVEFNKSQIVV